MPKVKCVARSHFAELPQAKIIYTADKGDATVLHVHTATSAKAVLQPGAVDPLGYEECGKVATVTYRRVNGQVIEKSTLQAETMYFPDICFDQVPL